MGFLDSLKELFSSNSVNIGELNKASIPSTSTNYAIKYYEDNIDDIEVTSEYILVKNLIENNFPIVFVSGKAGTGKSTLIRYLRNSIERNVVVVAPTGVAALNVKGSTIHSFFHLPPRIILEEDIRKVKYDRLYKNLDVLIIDEISMVRVDIIDAIDKFLRLNGAKKNLPFGGVTLLMIGDLFQLPPVVNRREKEILDSFNYDSPYFFSSKSLEFCKLVPVELSKVFRQKDSEYTDILNKIRVAEHVDKVLPIINSRYNKRIEGLHIVTLTSTNADAEKINTTELSKLFAESKEFIGQATGKFAIQEERLPSPSKLILKVGAQVMFTKNGSNWINGTVGKIISFNENSIQVQLLVDSYEKSVDVHKAKWESYTYKFDNFKNKISAVVTGTYEQFPLMLAWAVTIHKSQGKTLEKIKIDLGNGAFTTGRYMLLLVELVYCQTCH